MSQYCFTNIMKGTLLGNEFEYNQNLIKDNANMKGAMISIILLKKVRH